MNWLKRNLKLKLKILAFFAFVLLVVMPTPAHAIEVPGVFKNFIEAVKDPGTSLQKFSIKIMEYMVSGGIQILGGCPPGLTCAPEYKQGAVTFTSEMVAGLYSAPYPSGVGYVAYTLQDFGLVESAHAQTGTGFQALAPLLPLWRAFRNLTYVLFVVIFAGSGLAIMFRMKLSPQAVITIQSALPRIVVALLLVTFSYAIVGLMIDLMYIIIALGAGSLHGVGNPPIPGNQWITQYTENGGFFNMIGRLFFDQIPLGLAAAGLGLGAALGAGIGGLLAVILGAIIAIPVGTAVGVGALLVVLILIIFILVLLIRLFFQLLQSYIAIIFLTILSPLYIAMGVMPGMPGFGAWLRTLMAHILVFPAVAFVLMIGRALVHHTSAIGLWAPPIMPFTGAATDTAGIIIGIGIMLIIHQIPQATRAALGVRGLGLVPDSGAAGTVTGVAGRAVVGQTLTTVAGSGHPLAGPAGALFGALRAARII